MVYIFVCKGCGYGYTIWDLEDLERVALGNSPEHFVQCGAKVCGWTAFRIEAR